MLFSDYHLAKLNPKCYMNYSIIFTEISFSPETSTLMQYHKPKVPFHGWSGLLKFNFMQSIMEIGQFLYVEVVRTHLQRVPHSIFLAPI